MVSLDSQVKGADFNRYTQRGVKVEHGVLLCIARLGALRETSMCGSATAQDSPSLDCPWTLFPAHRLVAVFPEALPNSARGILVNPPLIAGRTHHWIKATVGDGMLPFLVSSPSTTHGFLPTSVVLMLPGWAFLRGMDSLTIFGQTSLFSRLPWYAHVLPQAVRARSKPGPCRPIVIGQRLSTYDPRFH